MLTHCKLFQIKLISDKSSPDDFCKILRISNLWAETCLQIRQFRTASTYPLFLKLWVNYGSLSQKEVVIEIFKTSNDITKKSFFSCYFHGNLT